MADAEVATDGVVTAESVEPPPSSSEPVDLPPPTVNGVAEPITPADVPAAVDAAPAEEAPSSKSGVTGPSAGAPRVDVSDDSGKTSTTLNKYELHDKEAESADRVAAALKSARLQVDDIRYIRISELLTAQYCYVNLLLLHRGPYHRTTLLFTIPPVLLGGFLHFMYQ